MKFVIVFAERSVRVFGYATLKGPSPPVLERVQINLQKYAGPLATGQLSYVEVALCTEPSFYTYCPAKGQKICSSLSGVH